MHFQEINNRGDLIENHYPSRLLGFISIEGKCEAVIQCSVKPLLWSTVDVFDQLKLGTDFNISFVSVPIDACVRLLCVISDWEGDTYTYFAVLPKQNWSHFLMTGLAPLVHFCKN